jgi:hypothetical protein
VGSTGAVTMIVRLSITIQHVAQHVSHRFLQRARFTAQDKSMSYYFRNT